MQTFLVIISAILLTLSIPVSLISQNSCASVPSVCLTVDCTSSPPSEPSEYQIVLKDGNSVEQVPLEAYLVQVVLSEMPGSFHKEALKAQAVAARTFALYRIQHPKHSDADLCTDSQCCQAWQAKKVLQQKLGPDWDKYWEKAQEAVRDTQGQVLTYRGDLIEAVYFSCSGGQTEDAVAVWGTDIPYLQSVSSSGEEDCKHFHQKSIFSAEEFQAVLRKSAYDISLSEKPNLWFGPVEYSDGGGVISCVIGGTAIEGTVMRSMFDLPSTQFEITVADDLIIFDTYGYGHRVGMSQYGANAMASHGSSYIDILSHYYVGTKIETKNP